MLPFPFHVLGCLSPIPVPLSCNQGGFGSPLPSSLSSSLIVGVSDPFRSPPESTGGRGAAVFSTCFPGLPVDSLGDRSLLTGSGAAQQPVTIVHQLGVHNAIHLFRVITGQRKKNDNMAQSLAPVACMKPTPILALFLLESSMKVAVPHYLLIVFRVYHLLPVL